MDKGIINSKMSYVTAAAVSVGTVIVIYVWYAWNEKSKRQKLPSTWRLVAKVNRMSFYPVKSMGPLLVDGFDCTAIGPKYDEIGDRTFLVLNSSCHLVTGRQHPLMTQISPSITGSVLTLTSPDKKSSISVDTEILKKKKNDIQCTFSGVTMVCRDCGDEVAKWLSRVILQADVGLRLAYYPFNYSTRPTKPRDKPFPLITSKDTGVYHDETSFSLLNEASFDDLCKRVKKPGDPLQFRMNFIVRSSEPYEEDKWEWVKIGDVVFRNIRPCTRCVMTTIDPKTGKKNEKTEPLKSLKEYRQISDPKFRRYIGEAPVMGIHLGLKGSPGTVRVGDPVYVGVI